MDGIEPQALGAPPRPVRVKESYLRARFAFMVVLATVALILGAFHARHVRRQLRLAREGRVVEGRVRDRSIGRSKSTVRLLTVEYAGVGGTAVEEFRVSRPTFDAFPPGSTIPVVVDPQDPGNTFLFRMSKERIWGDLQLGGLAWVCGLTLVVVVFALDAGFTREQAKQLAEWPLGRLRVQSVEATARKAALLKVSGSILDARGGNVRYARIEIAGTVQVDDAIAVLYGPRNDEVVPLDGIRRVEPF